MQLTTCRGQMKFKGTIAITTCNWALLEVQVICIVVTRLQEVGNASAYIKEAGEREGDVEGRGWGSWGASALRDCEQITSMRALGASLGMKATTTLPHWPSWRCVWISLLPSPFQSPRGCKAQKPSRYHKHRHSRLPSPYWGKHVSP